MLKQSETAVHAFFYEKIYLIQEKVLALTLRGIPTTPPRLDSFCTLSDHSRLAGHSRPAYLGGRGGTVEPPSYLVLLGGGGRDRVDGMGLLPTWLEEGVEWGSCPSGWTRAKWIPYLVVVILMQVIVKCICKSIAVQHKVNVSGNPFEIPIKHLHRLG